MLTIIIPSYNHQDFIESCITGAMKVTIPGLTILVIDDGSSDETVDRANRQLHNWQDHRVIQKKNSGLISSLNLGLALARTEFVYFVASDDVANAEGIQACIDLLVENQDAKFCIGGAMNVFESGAPSTSAYVEAHDVFFNSSPSERARLMFLDYPSPVLLQSTIFRRQSLLDIGGWDEGLILDDYPTFIKLLSKYPESERDFFYRKKFIVVDYRHHGMNSYRDVKKQFNRVSQVISKLAPVKLIHRSLGKAAAYYALLAFSYGAYSVGCHLLSTQSARSLLWVPVYLSKFIHRKLKK